MITPTRGATIAAAAALVAAGTASGYERPAELSRVASIFARHAVEVRCPSAGEWAADPRAAGVWSYADLRGDHMVLGPALCAGASRVADPEVAGWQRAAGVLAVVHESYHLRRWRHRRDEARVTCAAIQQFPVAALLLGASHAVANGLLPYALALHLRTVQLFPLYRARACRLPVWLPPDEPSS